MTVDLTPFLLAFAGVWFVLGWITCDLMRKD